MKKTYTFGNDNGVFISFLDFEDEADLDAFIAFLGQQLDVSIPEPVQSPYSVFVEFAYGGTNLTASFVADAGCYLHIPLGSGVSAEEIVATCYPPAAEN